MLEILAAFMTFRLTVLLSFEKGPALLFYRFRLLLGVMYDPEGKRVIGKKSFPLVGTFLADVITCPWCLSIWIGLGVAWALGMPLWYGIAFSGVTLLLVEKGL